MENILIKRVYCKNKNIGMIDTGPIMRRIHKEMDPDISMGDWVKN